MQHVDIVYLYESIAREMDVACVVTAILRERYGVSVKIAQWPQSVPRLYGRVSPRVVVLPFCYFEHSFDCLLEWRHATFVNLTWEQLFYRGNVRAKTPRGDFAVNHVLHHAWSDAYADFARAGGIPDEHLFVNGQPAYTLYDEPYRDYFVQRDELAARHRLDPAKRWVFFPENYNWAFYSPAALKAFVTRGQSAAEIDEMRAFCTRSFEVVMRWFAELARTGAVEVIVRPRPATALADFRAAVERVVPGVPDAMHLIQAETVREWIMASDVVLSSHSTSLIEAAVARRPAYMVTPFPVPETLTQEWHTLVPRLENYDDVRSAALGRRDAAEQAGLATWARTRFMSRGDSIENLAAYLAAVVAGDRPRPPVPSRLRATAQGDIYVVPKWVWFLFRRMRARFRRMVPDTSDLTVLREYLAPAEIDRRVDRWARLLQPFWPAGRQAPAPSTSLHAGAVATPSQP
jgi:surface carbohydrate biosynthesis protein